MSADCEKKNMKLHRLAEEVLTQMDEHMKASSTGKPTDDGKPDAGAVAAPTLLERSAAVEKRVCATGTAWGLLRGAPLWALFLWWAVRHGIYVITAFLLLAAFKGAAIPIGVFVVAVHVYKVIAFVRNDAAAQKQERVQTQPADAGEDV